MTIGLCTSTIVLCNSALPNDFPVTSETCSSLHILKHLYYLKQMCAFVRLHHNICIITHRMENVKFFKSSSCNNNLVIYETGQYHCHDSVWRMHVGLLTSSCRFGRLSGAVQLGKCDTARYNAGLDTEWMTWLGRGWQCSRFPTSAYAVHSTSILGPI